MAVTPGASQDKPGAQNPAYRRASHFSLHRMVIGRPVWTEDADFFGTGIATWTTDRVALYLTA